MADDWLGLAPDGPPEHPNCRPIDLVTGRSLTDEQMAEWELAVQVDAAMRDPLPGIGYIEGLAG